MCACPSRKDRSQARCAVRRIAVSLHGDQVQPRRNEAGPPPARRDGPYAPRRRAPEPAREPGGLLPRGITDALSGLLRGGLETEDLLLMLILYLMYRESGDKELLIVLGAMLLL